MEPTIHIFLGGTCNETTWREKLIKLLPEGCTYFNPVVDNWTEACKKKELEEREKADIVLYTLTPKMTGVYSVAEVIDDSNKKPGSTILCLLTVDKDDGETIKFDKSELKSLRSVAELVQKNGGEVFSTLKDVAEYCGSCLEKKKAKNKVTENYIPDDKFNYYRK